VRETIDATQLPAVSPRKPCAPGRGQLRQPHPGHLRPERELPDAPPAFP
jgi:hypothetical protein